MRLEIACPPVLLISGKRDRFHPRPDVRLAIMRDAGHEVMTDEPPLLQCVGGGVLRKGNYRNQGLSPTIKDET